MGRAEELALLRRWVLEQRCRLVAVLGFGGIRKIALLVSSGLAKLSNGEQVDVTTIASASTTGMTSSTGVKRNRAFLKHLWRMAGLQYVGLFIIPSTRFVDVPTPALQYGHAESRLRRAA